MPLGRRESVLAIDLSTRRLGWATGAGRPDAYDEIELPGMKHLGRLYASVRNALCDLFAAQRPKRLVWCRAEYFEHDAVWEAHQSIRVIAELAAHDNGVIPKVALLRPVRLAVLGRGDFGERHASGIGFIPEAGRGQAKAAVAAWCAAQGYGGVEFETGNALVLHKYCEFIGRQIHGQPAGINGMGRNHPRGDAREAAR